MKKHFQRSARSRGFSLTEVIVALGIISMALVSLVGLISASLKSARESTDDTVLAAMVQSIRGQVLRDIARAADANGHANIYDDVATVDNTSYYFDATGNLLRDSQGGAITKAQAQKLNPLSSYECNLTLIDPAVIESKAPGAGTAGPRGQYNFPSVETNKDGVDTPMLRIVRAELLWPPLIRVQTAKANYSQQKKYFYISLTDTLEPKGAFRAP